MWNGERNLLSKQRITLQQHRLDALETVCIGFLAKKHPHYTHLTRFEGYLKEDLPNHTPQFTIRHLKPKILAGFADAVQTEVLGIQTSMEHATRLDDILQKIFPLNTTDKEFFVSYKAGTDEDKMRSLYRIQNKWIEQVQVINIGGARNINKKIHLGLSQPVSLRDFIRTQPADPNTFHHAMDVNNGSKDGKPVIIVMPKYLKAAEDTYNDFRALEQEHRTTTANHSTTGSFPSDKSAHDEYAENFFACGKSQ